MVSRTAAERAPSPEAIEFVRFCYRRRRVGWPEIYDEMCAVAGRGLFRGWGCDELAAEGIGLTLFEMPALAALVNRVVAEEQERRARIATAGVRMLRSEERDPGPLREAEGAIEEDPDVDGGARRPFALASAGA